MSISYPPLFFSPAFPNNFWVLVELRYYSSQPPKAGHCLWVDPNSKPLGARVKAIMEEDFNSRHFDLSLCFLTDKVSFPVYLLTRKKDPEGKIFCDGN